MSAYVQLQATKSPKTASNFSLEYRPPPGRRASSNGTKAIVTFFAAAFLACLYFSRYYLASCMAHVSQYQHSQAHSQVGPLDWQECTGVPPGPARCAFLPVPLDYLNHSAGTANIALSLYPATKSPRKGMILFNPGGPGGEGRTFVAVLGMVLQSMLGEDYDIVGFDPRGIGLTTPQTKCFTGTTTYADFMRNTVLARSFDIASNMSTTEARRLLIAQQKEANALYKAQFDVCAETMGESLRYMGTTTVVRDMDYITKTIEGDDALINFYGASYGTILGQYLVNMLPSRVGRIAIDGVADAVAWANQPYYTWYRQWMSSTTDAYNVFLKRCSEVGPSICPLASETGEKPAAIRNRIENFIDGLFYEPLSVHDSKVPGILTAGRTRIYLLSALQSPLKWTAASIGLYDAMQGRGAIIMDAVAINPKADLTRSAVSCNDNAPFDAPDPANVIDELLGVFNEVSRLVFGVVTTEPDGGCQYWPVDPPERFEGPWNHTLRNPILVLSNTADPVTPLASGKLVQERLGNSARLVVQDSPGHCSLAMYSSCTVTIMRNFFANGSLPAPDTVCNTEALPFPKDNNDASISSDLRQVMQESELVAKAMDVVHRGFPLDSLWDDVRVSLARLN